MQKLYNISIHYDSGPAAPSSVRFNLRLSSAG